MTETALFREKLKGFLRLKFQGVQSKDIFFEKVCECDSRWLLIIHG